MKLNHNLKYTAIVSGAATAARGSIKGKVLKLGIKFPCFVSVYDRLTRQLLETVSTDNQGNYQFDNLALSSTFFVLATDPAKQYNAVIQDMVVPK